MMRPTNSRAGRLQRMLLTQAVLVSLSLMGSLASGAEPVQALTPHAPTPPTPNCQCGCTVTGQCTCPDCDHPQLTRPAMTRFSYAGDTSCANGVCGLQMIQPGQVMSSVDQSACLGGACLSQAANGGCGQMSTQPRRRFFRRRRR